MIKKKILMAVILLIFVIYGCVADTSKEESNTLTLYINHYKSECYALFPTLCLQIKTNSTDPWSFLYDGIEGFEYQWGYNYIITVKEEAIANPPADGSSVKYKLLEVITQDKASINTAFTISISQPRDDITFTKISDSVYKIYGDKNLVCEATDCAAIDLFMDQKMGVLLELNHQLDPSLPLKLSQIKCSSPSDTFRQSCL